MAENYRRRSILQKPLKLRHMLSQYGEVGRLYLAPEGQTQSYSAELLYAVATENFSNPCAFHTAEFKFC